MFNLYHNIFHKIEAKIHRINLRFTLIFGAELHNSKTSNGQEMVDDFCTITNILLKQDVCDRLGSYSK